MWNLENSVIDINWIKNLNCLIGLSNATSSKNLVFFKVWNSRLIDQPLDKKNNFLNN